MVPPDAHLPPPPGKTTLESKAVGGGFPNAGSAEPSISANGRWVAFTSAASNIVPVRVRAPLPVPAVYLRDRRRDTTIRLPLPAGLSGGQATDTSISADGSVVAFTYQPPAGLAAAFGPIVMAWDRATRTTSIVSRNVKGAPADQSRQPSVSGDGRYVAYMSQNNGMLRIDTNEQADVFRYDRETQQTILVSVGIDGQSTSGASSAPSISGDGNLVAFQSDGGDSVVNEDTGNGSQVYVRDIAAGTTERISKPPNGGQANGEAGSPAISLDGRYVAFESTAFNLAPGDDQRFADVLRRDRTDGTTVLVSVNASGAPGDGPSGQASISTDGGMVAFASSATDIVPAATAQADARLAAVANLRNSEVYERDIDAAETILVSVATDGKPGGSRNVGPVVAGGGRYVAFASLSNKLVRGDRLDFADVFLRDFPPAPRLNPAVIDLGSRAVGSPAVPAAAVLSNTGWSPLKVGKATVTGSQKADFSVVLDSCDGRVLRRGEACTVTVTFAPTRKGARAATLAIPDDYTGSPRTAKLRGSGSQARLQLSPDLGTPGTVVIASGSGFPPNAEVRLSWTRGITPKLPVVVADARGRFRIQVLVFHNDLTGPRELTAESVARDLFPAVSVRMLVTRPSVQPPSFLIIRRLVDLPILLILRG